MTGPALAVGVVDRILPMHAIVSGAGRIRHAGPTLAKILAQGGLADAGFADCFEVRRPRAFRAVADLAGPGGARLALRLRDGHRTDLKGLALPLGDGGGVLVNMAFGISAVDAVGRYRLSAADFPPTDLTVEMLYLVEAQRAVLDESRSLNRRLQGARIAAEEQAFTDTLTGVRNRRAMDHVLSRYAEAGMDFAVMHLDLDWFKAVNDTHGHAAGDHVLQVAARILLDETRDDDTVARAGGDEFVLIFPGLVVPDRLAAVARRILARLAPPIPFQGAACRISASIGIATTADGETGEALLRAADAALYLSKNAGRGRFSFAADMAGAGAGTALAVAPPGAVR